MTGCFIMSYAEVDRTWAEWISWQLRGDGFDAVPSPAAGDDVGIGLGGLGADENGPTSLILVLSPVYVGTVGDAAERRLASSLGSSGQVPAVVRVRVHRCGQIDPASCVDLFDLEEDEARQRLLAAVRAVQPASGYGSGAAAPWFPGRAPVAVCRARYERLLAAHGVAHPDVLTAGADLAAALVVERDYSTARHLYELVLHHRRNLLGADHPESVDTAYQLGMSLMSLQEYPAARELLAQVVAHRRRTLGEDHPDTVAAAADAADALHGAGDTTAARAELRATLARARQVLGEDNPQTVGIDRRLAIQALSSGDRGPAGRDAFEAAVTRARQTHGADHLSTIGAEYTLASVLQMQGDHPAARAAFTDCLEHARRALGEDHEFTVLVEREMATELLAQGDVPAARSLLGDALERSGRILGADHPDTAETAARLAVLTS
jgi:tetratricopeptide (TPR) repeat protein